MSLLKLISWQWWVAVAAVLVSLASVWFMQVSNLERQIASEKVATANERAAKVAAEKALSDRIAAEAKAVADAVTVAREQEQIRYASLQRKYDDLAKGKKSDGVAASDSRERLYNAAASSQVRAARCPSDANVPNATAAIGGTGDAAQSGLHPEDRTLIDGLLQVARDANAAVRDRNALSATYTEAVDASR